MMRKGLMKGSGKPGYYNVVGKDPMVHSQSARGIKQPQRIIQYNVTTKKGTKGNIYTDSLSSAKGIATKSGLKRSSVKKGGKLSLEERKQIANTIYQQMGAGRFKMMTGARDFVMTEKGLQFRIPKCKDGINLITIELNGKDLYNVTFYSMTKGGLSLVKKAENKDIYNDQLREIFTQRTGLYTSLGGKWPSKEYWDIDKFTMDVEPADTSVGIMDDTYTLYADRGKKKDIELVFGSRRMSELMDITEPYVKKREAMIKWEKEEFKRWKKENPKEYKKIYGNKKIG